MVFTIWLLVFSLNGQPQVIEWFDTLEQCEDAIIGDLECVEGTVYRSVK